VTPRRSTLDSSQSRGPEEAGERILDETFAKVLEVFDEGRAR